MCCISFALLKYENMENIQIYATAWAQAFSTADRSEFLIKMNSRRRTSVLVVDSSVVLCLIFLLSFSCSDNRQRRRWNKQDKKVVYLDNNIIKTEASRCHTENFDDTPSKQTILLIKKILQVYFGLKWSHFIITTILFD